MNKKLTGLFLIVLLLSVNVIRFPEAKAASGSVPVSIAVNGTLVISDASNDTQSGENPTKNVSLTVTPDLGHTVQSGSAAFRLRTNKSSWRLTAQRTASSTGNTNISDADVKVDIAKTAGSSANANSAAIASTFASQTDLSSISTSSAVDVINGSAKTSADKDPNNTNNYVEIGTTYSIQPDFFYTPGTFSSTITYSFVSP